MINLTYIYKTFSKMSYNSMIKIPLNTNEINYIINSFFIK